MNQQNHDPFTTSFPKDPSLWLSQYKFSLQLIEPTSEDDVDGGLSWLVGSILQGNRIMIPHYCF
jgi:hypothetical protein